MLYSTKVNLAKSLIALSATAALVSPSVAGAQEEVVCTVVYGQGEVCGVKTTKEEVLGVHEPVEAGLKDINFLMVASALGIAGAAFFLISKLTRRVYLLDR